MWLSVALALLQGLLPVTSISPSSKSFRSWNSPLVVHSKLRKSIAEERLLLHGKPKARGDAHVRFKGSRAKVKPKSEERFVLHSPADHFASRARRTVVQPHTVWQGANLKPSSRLQNKSNNEQSKTTDNKTSEVKLLPRVKPRWLPVINADQEKPLKEQLLQKLEAQGSDAAAHPKALQLQSHQPFLGWLAHSPLEHEGSSLETRKTMRLGAQLLQKWEGLTFGKLLFPSILMILLLGILFAYVFYQDDDGDAVSEGTPEDLATLLDWAVPVHPSAQGDVKYHPGFFRPKHEDDSSTAHGKGQTSPALLHMAMHIAKGKAGPAPNSKADLMQIGGSSGSWMRTYEKADGQCKEALEMLFCCNIIPVAEFAESYVNQEQIDEYIWIARQMLEEKTLKEWVHIWPEAVATFEESSSACAAARQDAGHHAMGSLTGSSSTGLPGRARTQSDPLQRTDFERAGSPQEHSHSHDERPRTPLQRARFERL